MSIRIRSPAFKPAWLRKPVCTTFASGYGKRLDMPGELCSCTVIDGPHAKGWQERTQFWMHGATMVALQRILHDQLPVALDIVDDGFGNLEIRYAIASDRAIASKCLHSRIRSLCTC